MPILLLAQTSNYLQCCISHTALPCISHQLSLCTKWLLELEMIHCTAHSTKEMADYLNKMAKKLPLGTTCFSQGAWP